MRTYDIRTDVFHHITASSNSACHRKVQTPSLSLINIDPLNSYATTISIKPTPSIQTRRVDNTSHQEIELSSHILQIEKPSSNYNKVNTTTMMKSKHSHNKFVRFVTLPFRVLGKARDLYVRSMINCAEGRTFGQPMGGTLPKSFSARSTLSSESDDYGELVRAASVRSMGHLNEIDMLLKQHMQMRSSSQQQQLGSNGKARFPKSCSVGMAGFMGRIDEEKPGDLGEDGSVRAKTKSSSDSVYPRSKSVAVAF